MAINKGFLMSCLVGFAALQAWAQAPAQVEPEMVSHEIPVTFSSRVNLVSVPVVIRDKNGHGMGGLKREDFQLLDKGKLQVITKFSVQTNTQAVVAAAATSVAPNAAGPSTA